MSESKIPYIEFKNVSKSFQTVNGPLEIISDASFKIFPNEKVAIVGPSGSGKTTTLSLLAGLDTPTGGEILVCEQNIADKNETDLARYRSHQVGVIFQSFELIMPFNVEENIGAPLEIAQQTNPDRVTALIDRVGLSERREAFPKTLSGGEKQRVAIARALANNPPLILADEPTGSLDGETGERVLDLLFEEIEREQKTLVVITHNEEIAKEMDRVLVIENKRIYERS